MNPRAEANDSHEPPHQFTRAPMTLRGRSAFTLAELLLCIGLIAILAAWLAELLRWRQSPKAVFSQPTAFSPDLTLLAGGNVWGFYDDRSIKLCDTATGYVSTLPGHSGGVFSLAFSSDGNLLASGTKDTIKVWDVRSGRERASFKDTGQIYALALSPDGQTLATGNEDNDVCIWDIATQRHVATIQPYISVTALAFSPDGQTLAMGGMAGCTKLWDLKQSREVMTFQGHVWEINSLAFSPDGTKLASGSGDSTVKSWDLTNGQRIATMKHDVEAPNPHSSQRIADLVSWGVNAVAFSPDGKLLASVGKDWKLKVWEMPGGRLAADRKHTHPVVAVAFSRDGKTLATASDDGIIRFWDVGSWQLRHTAVFGTKRPLHWTPFAIGLVVWIVAWIAVRRRRWSREGVGVIPAKSA
jgi:WD40 repeat protein